jgi:dihydroflavonol-4-reductase
VPSLNESNKVIADVVGGKYPGIVSLAWGFVDVRDVARAHLEAAERKEAKGRYLCANVTMTMRELVGRIARVAPGHRVPKMGFDNGIGNFFTRAGSVFYPRGARATSSARTSAACPLRQRQDPARARRPVHRHRRDAA